jgi:hypothetical protein
MEIPRFLRLLQETVDGGEGELLEAPGLESRERQGELTLLALMPCGLKVPFSRTVTAFLEGLKAGLDWEIRYAVEGNVNQELSYYSYVNGLEKVEELPDIIVSSDFNVFFGRSFHRRFVAGGALCGYGRFRPGRNFTEAGIPDPEGEYAILAVNPLVMVVNCDELGNRPLPVCWADLLDPMWERSLTLRGNDDFFCHAVLLPTYKHHGAAGLRQLAGNVLAGRHPAQMVKQIDAGAPGAVYVMPEFFAHRIRNQERIRIVWPADGALASPVTLQVKSSRVDELRPVLDFLTGPELARVLAGARFPVPHREIKADIQEKPLQWLGWDYLRGHDLLELNTEIDRIFLPLACNPSKDG